MRVRSTSEQLEWARKCVERCGGTILGHEESDAREWLKWKPRRFTDLEISAFDSGMSVVSNGHLRRPIFRVVSPSGSRTLEKWPG